MIDISKTVNLNSAKQKVKSKISYIVAKAKLEKTVY